MMCVRCSLCGERDPFASGCESEIQERVGSADLQRLSEVMEGADGVPVQRPLGQEIKLHEVQHSGY